MKFGLILAREQSDWRHLDYAMLKKLIKDRPARSVFDAALLAEVKAVDEEFHERQLSFDECFGEETVHASGLRSFAVLNYLALRKIEKKAIKWLGPAGGNASLVPNAAFCQSLVGSRIFIETERACLACLGDRAKSSSACPVCLEPFLETDAATLKVCGHAFCWKCLAECAAAGFGRCPICRTEQELDPALSKIEDMLGHGANFRKYDPKGLVVAEAVAAEAANADPEADEADEADEEADEEPNEAAKAIPTLDTVLSPVPSPVPSPALFSAEPSPLQLPTAESAAAEPQLRHRKAPPSPILRLPTAAEEAASARRAQRHTAALGNVSPQGLRILTWNVAAIAFPFRAPSLQVLAGVLLWQDWTDVFADLPILTDTARGTARLLQQADYIRASAADLVMLQEVSGKRTLDVILARLGGEYEASYVAHRPTAFGISMFGLAVALLAAVQLVLVELAFAALALAPLGSLPLRFAALAVAVAARWRHSVVAQYLLGSIAGQLVVLRRKRSALAAAVVETRFEAFIDACSADGPMRSDSSSASSAPPKKRVSFSDAPDADAVEAEDAAPPAEADCAVYATMPRWQAQLLSMFFRLRPRGLQEVSVRLGAADGSDSALTLLNTHLPHLTNNSAVVEYCATRISSAATAHPTVFSGDLNPDTSLPIRSQFGAIFASGAKLAPSNTGHALITWDQQNPLIEGKPTEPSVDVQLDFLFFKQPPPAPTAPTASERSGSPTTPMALPKSPRDTAAEAPFAAPRPRRIDRAVSELLRSDAFFVAGAPLSDHIGMLTTLEIA